MIVNKAKTAGFCFGVKRAVDMVEENLRLGKPVYTFGPVIHNENVTEDFCKRGVHMINDVNELPNDKKGVIVIRSHGISKTMYDEISDLGFEIADATCPFVKKIHDIVFEKKKEGYTIIIVGDKNHPEVEGILGWCNNEAIVINSTDDIEKLKDHADEKMCMVAQTTFNSKKFQDFVEIINKKGYDISVISTICSATEQRQREAEYLAKRSDAMIVIGDTHSSNTRKLYEISKQQCVNTYFIQKLIDLDLSIVKSFRSVGITAGASTPNKIIEEVLNKMEESFAELLEGSFKTIHNGEVVEGTVICVKEDEIVLNIGAKSDGIITRNEYTNTPNVDLRTLVKEGDTLAAKVLKVNDGEGQTLLSFRKLAAERGSKKLEEAFNNKEVLKGVVSSILDGGLSVIIDETRIFIPASLASDSFEKDLNKFKDQEIEFVIIEFNPRKRRIIGDRKQLLVAKKAEVQKALLEKIKVGDVISGTVKNVTDFGVFIDLGGVDGLLHISEMSWGRVENPKKAFKIGDTVRAFIKDIQGDKIALSLKFEDQNPWVNAEKEYAVGTVVTGKVARMTDFGAFIELMPGVDALLHVSQISKDHIDKPSDVLKIGQEITAKVVDFNLNDKKISLSIKALEAPEEEAVEETTDAE